MYQRLNNNNDNLVFNEYNIVYKKKFSREVKL